MIENHQELQALKILISFNLVILLIGVWFRKIIRDIKDLHSKIFATKVLIILKIYIYSKSSTYLMFKYFDIGLNKLNLIKH